VTFKAIMVYPKNRL